MTQNEMNSRKSVWALSLKCKHSISRLVAMIASVAC